MYKKNLCRTLSLVLILVLLLSLFPTGVMAELGSGDPPVVTGPQSITVIAGSSASFTVTAEVYAPPAAYQWENSTDSGNTWVPIESATAAKYDIAAATKDMDGSEYQCIVTDADNLSTTSSAAVLTVTEKKLALAIEKFTLGLGYHTEPVWINFQDGQRFSEIVADFLGDGNYRSTGGFDTNFYLSGIKDQGNMGEPNPPAYIMDHISTLGSREEPDWLQEFDYTGQAGWLYMVNNQLPNYGMSNYIPHDGDVVRLMFTIYGLGSDVSVPTWGDPPIQSSFANYDVAIKVLADFNANPDRETMMSVPRISNAYNALIAKVTDLTSSQSDVNTALANFQASLVPVDKAALLSAIADAEELDQTMYSSQSWSDLQTALITAKAVNDSDAATSADVNAACTALTTAISKLVVLSQKVIPISNSKIKAALAVALGKGADYTGDVKEGELNEIKVPVNLSNTDATDDDIRAIGPLLKSTPSIDLSDNIMLTSDAVDYYCFDWTTPKSLDFSGCTGITEIPETAFVNQETWEGCPLTGFIFPETVTGIGSYAFWNTQLKELTIPNATLGDSVFDECSKLEKIIFAEGITEVPDNMFMNKSSLKEVILPGTLQRIGYYSFYGTGLDKLTLPSNLTRIEDNAFASTSITELIINSTTSTYGNSVFSDCQQLENVTLADGMTAIPDSMFVNCKKLKAIVLPQTVTSVGNNAFQNTGITAIDFSCVTSFGSGVLADCADITDIGGISFGALTEIPSGMFSGCKNIKQVVIPEGITTLGDNAFLNATGIKAVQLPSTLKKLGDYVFFGCKALVSVTFAEGLQEISNYAFGNDAALMEISLPASVTKLSDGCFSNTGISGIDISNVTTLGKEVFSSCKNITDISNVKFNRAITSLNDTFKNCIGLTKIALPAQIKTISANTFTGCNGATEADFSTLDLETFSATLNGCTGITSIDKVKLPAGLTKIPDNLYYNCTGLKSINIPEAVTEIGRGAFYNIGAYTVIIPENVTKIGDGAFSQCKNLVYIEFPKHVQALKQNTLNGCSNLLSVKLPETTDNSILGNSFFKGCSNLTSVKLPATVDTLDTMAFSDSAVLDINFDNVKYFGTQTFMGCKIENVIFGKAALKIPDTSTPPFNQAHSLRFVSLPATSLLPEDAAEHIIDYPLIQLFNHSEAQRTFMLLDASKVKGFTAQNAKDLWIYDQPYTTVLYYTTTDSRLSATDISLSVGGTQTITHSIPADKTIFWGSANPKVAEVQNGVITGKAKGTTYVYVKSSDDTYNGLVKVTVTNDGEAGLKNIVVSGLTLLDAFSSTKYIYTASAYTGDDMNISVVPLDSRAVVEVNGTKVIPGTLVDVKGCGLIEITVTAVNGVEKTYKVGVGYTLRDAPFEAVLVEELPAPGQFITDPVWKHGSLGGFGGYKVMKFDNPLVNDPKNPYGVDFSLGGNAFPGWHEPGSVMVAQDNDHDGKPDKWYDIAGSWHYRDEVKWDYAVTYYNPTPGEFVESKNIPWTDNYGGSGEVFANGYHGGSYFPNPAEFPLAPADLSTEKITYTGVYLPSSLGIPGKAPDFGHFDVHGSTTAYPLNPYLAQGEGIDISWAVDEKGLPVQLDQIDFVKIYSSILGNTGATGDLSPEFGGITRTATNAVIGETPAANGIKVLYGDGQTLDIPIEDGKYVYNADITDSKVKILVDTAAENIYINDKKTAPNAVSVDISTGKKVIRIITQSGINEPDIYYINLGAVTSAVDKTVLQNLIISANTLVASDYTAETWIALVSALSAAKTISEKADASQNDVDTAVTILQQAIDGLVKTAPEQTVDKVALNTLITSTASLVQSEYTTESWAALATALSAANAVNNSADAKQDEVDAAVTTLQQAIDGLVKAVPVVPKETQIQNILAAVSQQLKGSEADWDAMDMAAYGMGGFMNRTLLVQKALALYNNANRPATDFERVVISMTSLGINARKVDDGKGGTADFIGKIANFKAADPTPDLGTINNYIFALIAYDSGNYTLPGNAYWTREKVVNHILSKQFEDGGWALSGSTADTDITAMAVSSLINYKKDARVSSAIDKAVSCLSAIQTGTGGFKTMGGETSESSSMVIVALAGLGINPDTDTRFVKNGKSVIDALLAYKTADNLLGHANTTSNGMASEQGFRALVAYTKMLEAGKAYNIYVFSDLSEPDPVSVDKSLLNTKIQEALALNQSEYTANSWSALSTALSAAQAVSGKEDATQAEVYAVTQELTTAISQLTKPSGPNNPDGSITVTFSLMGVPKHGSSGKQYIWKQNPQDFQAWIPATSLTLSEGDYVYDAFVKALHQAGLQYDETQRNYIGGIEGPNGWLYEFDNGDKSGWMYTVNGIHPSYGLREFKIKNGDNIVWHYTDDYRYEEGSDKAALNTLITSTASLVQSEYTTESWAALATALSAANAVNNSTDAKQGEVDAAVTTLQQAIGGLVKTAPEQTVDKAALKILITSTASLVQSEYTTESWAALATALSTANAINNSADAKQGEVDAAATTLQQAIGGLVKTTPDPVVDKAALKTLITSTASLVQSEYTTESWAALATALSTANAVNNSADAKQDEVDAAVTTLQQAIDGLVKAVPVVPKETQIQNILAAVSQQLKGSEADWDAMDMAAYGMGGFMNRTLLVQKALALYNNANRPATDFERVVISMTSLGINARKVDDGKGGTADFIGKIANFKAADPTPDLGTINNYIFALIAYDSGNYTLPGNAYWTREKVVNHILSKQFEDGGWALSGSTADTDITAMAVSSLINYKKDARVSSAIDKAVSCLSAIQTGTGGFKTMGGETSESSSMVIVALAGLGINPDTDTRFVKNGKSVIDALLAYKTVDNLLGHANTTYNGMASEQGFRALVAYTKMLEAGKAYNIYIFGDLSEPDPVSVDKSLLNTKIQEALALNQSEYTANSWSALSTALSAAQAVSGKEDATQAEVYAATQALIAAIGKLTKPSGPNNPDGSIAVTFSLMGVPKHGSSGKQYVWKQNPQDFQAWIPATSLTVAEGDYVYDAFVMALNQAGLQYDETQHNYIGGIKGPNGWLYEFDNGKDSGWMYTVNGTHPSYGLREFKIKNGDDIVWHYTDNYHKEEGSEKWPDENSPASAGPSAISGTSVEVEAVQGANGKATSNIPGDTLSNLLKNVQEAAGSSKAVAALNVKIPDGAKALDVVLSKEAAGALAGAKNTALKVSSALSELTFDAAAAAAVANAAKSAGTDITIAVAAVSADSLSNEAKAAIGSRPVYDFSVNVGNTAVSTFGGGSIRVGVPYTPAADEDKNAIVIYYINDKGGLEVVKNCRYDAQTGLVYFSTSHFSRYAVGYNKKSFTDITGKWMQQAVEYMAARGVVDGVGGNNFAPDERTTRAQFVTLLMRALAPVADASKMTQFSDVAAGKYYTDAVLQAKALGLVDGVGDNRFNPDETITREQMFTIAYRALEKLGLLDGFDKTDNKSVFNDKAAISSYAAEAVDVLAANGLVSGSGGKVNPKDLASRAECAQFLYNVMTGIK